MSGKGLIKSEEIQSRIYTVRGVQVMVDSDLAEIYGVETKVFNQAVKRNINRFPQEFMFQLNENEYDSLILPLATLCNENNLRLQIDTSNENQNLRSQIVTSSGHGGRRYFPYVFTEQGVAMLSAVLRSETAVNVSIHIINAFVAMRRFLISNAQVFQRLNTLEFKQLETDKRIDKVFNAIEAREILPRQGIFYDGQVFDAYKFVSDLIRTARNTIIIIDNYIDDTVLTHLTKRKKGVKVTILTKTISKQLALDAKKYNEQYPPVEIKEFKNSHDRFMIIDDKAIYHFGSSLKDLGKKWFAFSKMDIGAVEMLGKLERVK